MTTPQGLTRFTRSMPTRYDGHCTFCGTATRKNIDFAALSGGQKWLTVCVTCAQSITDQVIAVLTQLGDAQDGVADEVTDQVAFLMPDESALELAVSGQANDAVAYDVLVKLQGTLAALRSVMPAAAAPSADPRGALLQAIANNPNAAPRDRDFAGSLADWVLVKGRTLSVNQSPHADRLIAKYAAGAPAPVEAAGVGLYAHDDGTVRKVYETRNGHLAAKVLVVIDGHGSLQYEKGGRGIVSRAVAAGTAHVMTQDEAAAFGRLHSFCCNCCKDLDDDRSLAAGYGPTCAANNGWFYPTYEQAAAILGRPCGKASKTQAEVNQFLQALNPRPTTWICDEGGEHETGERCDCPADDGFGFTVVGSTTICNGCLGTVGKPLAEGGCDC